MVTQLMNLLIWADKGQQFVQVQKIEPDFDMNPLTDFSSYFPLSSMFEKLYQCVLYAVSYLSPVKHNVHNRAEAV